MAQQRSLNSLSVEELLNIVENEKLHKAQKSDVAIFVEKRKIKAGVKFYSNRFLHYLYLKDGYENISKSKFVRLMKNYVPYKRKKNLRGFCLNDLKEDIMDLYKSNQYEKENKKTT